MNALATAVPALLRGATRPVGFAPGQIYAAANDYASVTDILGHLPGQRKAAG